MKEILYNRRYLLCLIILCCLSKGYAQNSFFLNSQTSKEGSASKTNLMNSSITSEKLKPISLNIARTAQQSITGKVIDQQTGEPLISVSVSSKGAPSSTVTDVDGNYRLTVSDEVKTLIFTYIGYVAKEVEIEGRTLINTEMSADIKSLREVVVVGYGTVRKSDITGSVASVKSETLQSEPAADFSSILQGRVAGVSVNKSTSQPGGGSRINIRGISSFLSTGEPLYVIDGYIGAPGAENLSPYEIESIEVLKDASATSIYGSRGANGVIIITTKKGSSDGLKVDFASSYGLQTIGRKYELLNAQEYYDMYLEGAGRTGQTPVFEPGNLQVNTDWQGELYSEAGGVQDYNLTVTGGDKKTKFAVLGNYRGAIGLIKTSYLKRGNFRINFEHAPSDKLKFGFTASYGKREDQTVRESTSSYVGTAGPSQTVLQISPLYTPYQENGSYTRYLHPVLGDQIENPVAEVNEHSNTGFSTIGFLNGFVEFEILPGLKLNSSLGGDSYVDRNEQSIPIGITYQGEQTQGRASLGYRESFKWLNNNILNYSKSIGPHDFDILGGVTLENYKIRNFNGSQDRLLNNDLAVYNLGRGIDPGNPSNVGAGYSSWSLLSYLGRINYKFSEKYLLTLTGRYDGSSKFVRNNKWSFFPSIAGGWIISEEPFMQAAGAVSNMKLRMSYGKVGEQGIGAYATIPSLSVINNIYTGGTNYVLGVTPGSIRDENLKWEVQEQINAGLDMGLFNGRLNVTADVYRSTTNDLLFSRPIPASSGSSSVTTNVGGVLNKGIELAINSFNTVRDVKWSTGFNFTVNRSKVLELGEQDFFFIDGSDRGGGQGLGPGIRIEEGEEIGQIYGYVFDGVFQTQEEVDQSPQRGQAQPGMFIYRDLNNDGVLDGNDRRRIGSAQPDFSFGLTNNLSYKNFDLSVYLNAKVGYDLINASATVLESAQIELNKGKQMINRWNGPGTSNYYRGVGTGLDYRVSNRYVEDASYLKANNISLAYNLPGDLCRSLNLRSARLHVSGQNLFVITNYSGLDPEVDYAYVRDSGQNRNLGFGTDFGSYPRTRTITLGVNIGF